MVRLRHALEGGAPAFRVGWPFARLFITALVFSSLASPAALGAPRADDATAVTKTALVPAGVPVRAPLVSTEAVSGDTVSMILTLTSSISGQVVVTADVGGRTPEFSVQAPPGGTIRVSEGRSPDLPGNIEATVLVWDGTDQVVFTCTTTLSGEGVVRVPERCLVPAPRVTIEVDFPPRLQASPGALPSTGAGGMAMPPRSAPRAAARPVAALVAALVAVVAFLGAGAMIRPGAARPHPRGG